MLTASSARFRTGRGEPPIDPGRSSAVAPERLQTSPSRAPRSRFRRTGYVSALISLFCGVLALADPVAVCVSCDGIGGLGRVATACATFYARRGANANLGRHGDMPPRAEGATETANARSPLGLRRPSSPTPARLATSPYLIRRGLLEVERD